MAEQQKAAKTETSPLRAVKGMNDLLPPESARWEWFEDAVRRVMQRYGYAAIRTPIVEPTALFVRGLGEVTDIVEKEMYSFTDSMNGDQLTLRPEGTAGVVRAVTEHSLLYEGGKRLYYLARCSATSARRRAATASSIRPAPRRWAFMARTSMPS
ncbi:Histidine--tRNA ligase [Methylibium sp. T29]|nr:Histidine--tRNA ligase [Methylibium sp. T29]